MASSTRESPGRAQARPWLTWALLLACLLGFGAQKRAEHAAAEAVTRPLDAAATYLAEHPTLRVDPLLERHVGAEQVAKARETFEAKQRARGAPPVPPGIQRRLQQELDARVEQARELLGDVPARRWGLLPGAPAPAALALHPFVHASWLHLAASLLLIWVLGRALEATLGSVVAAVVALASLAAAAAAMVGLASGADPFLGMSGLLAGWWGALLLRRGGRPGARGNGAALALGALVLGVPAALGLDLVGGAPLGAPSPWVWPPSGWALVGGFAGGVAAVLLMAIVGMEAALAPAARSRRSAGLDRALARRAAGRREEAFEMLLSLTERGVEDAEAVASLWELAVELGRAQSAAPALLRRIRGCVQRGYADEAVVRWLDLVGARLEGTAEPALLIRMAGLLRDAGEVGAAGGALRMALDRAPGATAALRIAHEASGVDAETARQAAWRALGSLEVDLRERQQLEELLADLQPRLAVAPPRAPEPQGGGAEDTGSRITPGGSAIEFDQTTRRLERVEAVPLGLEAEGLQVELAGAGKRRLSFERIEAVSVAAVEGLAERPVIVIDLIFNWTSLATEPLRVVRIRSDRFDPRRLASGEQPADALRAFIQQLIEAADATPLPDLQSSRGMPFAGFKSLQHYHRDILMVD